jgi:hypothetical protein
VEREFQPDKKTPDGSIQLCHQGGMIRRQPLSRFGAGGNDAANVTVVMRRRRPDHRKPA